MAQGTPDPRPKVEPRATIRGAARVAFELYQSLVDEGFTRQEAKDIVADILAKAVNK